MEMFHQSLSRAVAHEQQTDRVQAADRRRVARVMTRHHSLPSRRRGGE